MCQASRLTMNKSERLAALLPNGRGVWIPIDHGMSDYPCDGLEDTEGLIRDLISAGVNAIVAQKGVVSHYNHLCEGTKTKMVIHLSASTTHGGEDSANKVLVGDAKEAVRRGAVGVSCQVNTGSKGEREMIKSMGKLSKQANKLEIPMFGICLGHQIFGLALGGSTYKLPFGHRGLNHPCGMNNLIEITSQNHGFAIDPNSLPKDIVKVTHYNLNDNTVAGLEVINKPIFSVQYHPEAGPGPHDSDYLFKKFVSQMLERC